MTTSSGTSGEYSILPILDQYRLPVGNVKPVKLADIRLKCHANITLKQIEIQLMQLDLYWSPYPVTSRPNRLDQTSWQNKATFLLYFSIVF